MKNKGDRSNVFLKVNQLLWRKSFLQRIRGVFYFIDGVLLMGIGKKSKRDNSKKKVLIIYNMALGDGVMYIGVANHLRDIFPEKDYELNIACQGAFMSLYEETGIFDRVIPFDFTGSVVNLKNRRVLFKKLREETYDIILDPIGCENCTTNIFVSRAVFAKEKIGVLDETLPSQCPKWMRKRIYTKVIRVHEPKLHLIQFYSRCMVLLGANNCVAHPAKLNKVELSFKLPDNFFIVFPTASMAVKRWPVENFAELARRIYDKTALTLLVCGTKQDENSVKEFLSYIPDIPVFNIIGKTSIMEFIEVIGHAQLILTNDTSAFHIGVAKQVNTIMICGGYTYNRYANYCYADLGYKDPVLVCKEMDCFNCDNHCIYSNKDVFPCIGNITVDDAWKQIETVIERM